MGSLLIQIGQCGCQIGNKLHENLIQIHQPSYLKRVKSDIFHTIMLDTQPKILKPIIQNRKKYNYLDPLNIKYFQYGRGNNWSYGYLDILKYKKINKQQLMNLNASFLTAKTFSKPKGDSFIQRYFIENTQIIQFTLDSVRKQIQKTDSFMGINVICSLGGGTGSGLGTRIVQQIKNNMNINIISHVILPNQSGQTPLQHYNCALSLASMYQNSDAIITYQNDKMTEILGQYKDYQGTLDQINDYIAHSMSTFFRLNDSPKYSRFYFDLIRQCVVSPELKFLELYVSYEKQKKQKQKWSWDSVMNSVYKQIQVCNRDEYNKVETKQKSLALQIIMKGNEQINFEKYEKKLKNLLNPINEIHYEQIQKKNVQKDCLILANRTRILRYLKYIIQKGQQKLKIGAYTWNYKIPLEPAFQTLNSIVENYQYCCL